MATALGKNSSTWCCMQKCEGVRDRGGLCQGAGLCVQGLGVRWCCHSLATALMQIHQRRKGSGGVGKGEQGVRNPHCGAPGQPILQSRGPLNPQSVSYPPSARSPLPADDGGDVYIGCHMFEIQTCLEPTLKPRGPLCLLTMEEMSTLAVTCLKFKRV